MSEYGTGNEETKETGSEAENQQGGTQETDQPNDGDPNAQQ